VRESIAEAEKSIETADRKRTDLETENEKLKAATEALSNQIGNLEERTLELLARLPEAMQQRVKVLSKNIPDDQQRDKTEQTLGRRYQNVIGTLNQLNKLNSEITITNEKRKLSSGQAVDVTVIYIGIGQAYYVGGDGRIGGVGMVTDEGWAWKEDNDAAPEIARALKILRNDQPAAFVRLPIEIQ
jgi:hypothetical protein